MNLHTKLENLKKEHNLVLFKWTAGMTRLGKNFIPLSDVRLRVLSCDNGVIKYSSAAPVLVQDKGRPNIQFRDINVMTVINGRRQGINIPVSFLKPDEQAIEARHCVRMDVSDDDTCPSWLATQIIAMGMAPLYSVTSIVTPTMYRMTKAPSTLKPIFNTEMMNIIGGSRADSMGDLMLKFQNNLDLFGYFTDDGYVINSSYIATGGKLCISKIGISTKNGSNVFMMPLSMFRAECSRLKWSIYAGGNPYVD